jgi:hypothetical protein
MQLSNGPRSPDFLDKAGALGSYRLGEISIPSHRLAAVGIGLCCLYATLTLGFIVYSFRQTVSSEIYFFAFWVLSVGLEALRLGIFDVALGGLPVYWQIALSKALLFARYAGSLSLFVSGLYAVGFHSEKLGVVAAIVLAVSLGLSIAIPINTGAYSPVLELKAGYSGLNEVLMGLIGLIAIANFVYAASSSGEFAYRLVALGSALFLAGRWILTTRWDPIAMIGGFVLLVIGSWLFVSRLHTYYLWQ